MLNPNPTLPRFLSEEPDDWREIMRLFLVRRTRSFIIKNYATLDERDGRPFLTTETTAVPTNWAAANRAAHPSTKSERPQAA